ncbi:cyclodeaminase/cyclohydrolase family protein [Propionibacteriaceae bacterium Y1700]|uniref:cyclodeaminase/cyclohydrolase family protein n=1 Tax=Microlunatus sp. Y1700 TaxID=3418487 RepID=UPI003DA748DE
MTDSIWSTQARDLLQQTASDAPTPGGGSVAAVSGALGVALIQMAVAVTADPALDESRDRLHSLRTDVENAADVDLQDFAEVMAAYRLPRTDEAAKAERKQAIITALIAATEHPLALIDALVEAMILSGALEPQVKASIVSDVLAGRDIARGAARAALHTVDINLNQLDRLGSSATADLRMRRNALVDQLEEQA